MATSEKLKDWGYHVAIGFDQFINAVLGGAADETLSSRIYRGAVLAPKPKKRWVFLHKIINGLFFWQKEHCKSAYKSEIERKQFPEIFRKQL